MSASFSLNADAEELTSAVDVETALLIHSIDSPSPTPTCWSIARQVVWNWLAFLLNSLVVLVAIVLLGLFVWTDPTLTWQGWFTLIFVYAVLLVLIADFLPTEWVLWTITPIFWLSSIITSSEALAGFSNTATVLVGSMFIVAKAIEETGIMAIVVRKLLGKPDWLSVAHLRLLVPASIISVFINNTPIVAILIPIVEQWLRQRPWSTTMFMMPLSFAVILGGTCSSIGTSTNMLIVGLAESNNPGFVVPVFEVSKVAVPCAVLGIVYMIVAAPFILPKEPRTDDDEKGDDDRVKAKQYSTLVRVEDESLFGQTLQQLGLADVQSLLLVQIRNTLTGLVIDNNHDDEDNDDENHNSNNNDENGSQVRERVQHHLLERGDVIACSGPMDALLTLLNHPGFVVASDDLQKVVGDRCNRVIVEAMLTNDSDLLGRTPSTSYFFRHRNAALLFLGTPCTPPPLENRSELVSISSPHTPLSHSLLASARMEDVALEQGVPFIYESSQESIDRHGISHFLYWKTVSVGRSVRLRQLDWKAILIIFLFVGIITLQAASQKPFFQSSLTFTSILLGSLSVVLGVITWDQALSAVRVKILLTIATSFALGAAVSSSGVAAVLANWMVNVFLIAGKWGVLFGLYLITALLTAILPNPAVANIVMPIAQRFSVSADVPLMSVVVILMLGSSARYVFFLSLLC